MIEKTDKRDEFLLKIGRRVYRPNEVEIGNTLGIAYPDSEDIKIKYTDYIQLKPDFIKFNNFPYVKFEPSFIGFRVSETLETLGFKYCYILPPENSEQTIWAPLIVTEGISSESQELQREEIELSEKEEERVYLVEKEPYKSLGELLTLVELPSLTFLPQSRNLEGLVKMLKNSEEDVELIRQASERLKKTFRCL